VFTFQCQTLTGDFGLDADTPSPPPSGLAASVTFAVRARYRAVISVPEPADAVRRLRCTWRRRCADETRPPRLVVEHEPETIAIAGHVVDLGPGAGTAGGTVCFEGTVDGLRASGTVTGSPPRRSGPLQGDGADPHRHAGDRCNSTWSTGTLAAPQRGSYAGSESRTTRPSARRVSRVSRARKRRQAARAPEHCRCRRDRGAHGFRRTPVFVVDGAADWLAIALAAGVPGRCAVRYHAGDIGQSARMREVLTIAAMASISAIARGASCRRHGPGSRLPGVGDRGPRVLAGRVGS
jgi:hypothetical protein